MKRSFSLSPVFPMAAVLMSALLGGWNCLEPNRFELDVNGPDGLLSFAAATSINTTANPAAGDPSATIPGAVVLSRTTVTVSETTNASVDYYISLSSAPAADVTITIAANPYLTITPTILTFTSSNWDQPRQVRVGAVENNTRDIGGIRTDLAHSLSSNDSSFDGLNFDLPVSVDDDNEKLIFLTANTYDGALASSSPTGESFGGADEKCNADPNKPAGSGNFIALISGQYYYGAGALFRRRAACFSGGNCASDEVTGVTTRSWSLAANTHYVRPDSTSIGTTNAARYFSFPLTNSFSDQNRMYWAGLTQPWTLQATGSTCYSSSDAWNSNSSALNGFLGRADSTSATAIADFQDTCDQFYHLVCVEQ